GLLSVGGDAVTVSSAITRHAGYNMLAISGGSITQNAPLSVANLDVSGGNVTLTNAGNDVDTLAGRLGGAVVFDYRDVNGVTVGNVGPDPGINGPLALVVLTSGGAITGGNGPATNVTANGLTATSASGIDLDTRVGALLINGNGPITLTEALNTRITSIRVGTGTVTLDGGTFI